MKFFVINLNSRQDRLEFISNELTGHSWERFPAVNGHNLTLQDIKTLGYTPYSKWVDPMLNRRLTITEIATAISHYELWKYSAGSNQPVLILEDDSRLTGNLNLKDIETLLKIFDIVYLDHKEMYPDRVFELANNLVRPYYPYWNNAYAISPRLAKRIVDSKFKDNLIPVDEFFPLISGVNYEATCLGNKQQFLDLKDIFDDISVSSPAAFKTSIFNQVSRSILGSDIENGKQIMSNNIHVLTVGTDLSKMEHLEKSAKKFEIDLVNLGRGVVWEGGTMQGPGGGQKLNLVKQHVKDLPSDDIVLFVDGYDVVFNDDIDTIVERFKGFNTKVLFAAEKTCWPDKSIASFFSAETEYKYLNSGLYIGYAGAILALLDDGISNDQDDQYYLQRKYIVDNFQHKKDLVLDTENYVFQCLAAAVEDVVIRPNMQLFNKATKCCPCILHGNGGADSKADYMKLVNQLFPAPPEIMFSEPGNLKEVSSDILEAEFLTPEMCAKLIEKAEAFNKWESMPGDKFPGQELRIRELDINLFNQLESYLREKVYPKLEKHWWPLQMYGIRDAFIIKYSPETQSSLKCHHDASLVSANIKLNDGYEGGETHFYRQKFNNKDTPVGNAIYWPSQVTHGHEGLKVTSGTKYNLVIWTGRNPGDVNY